MYPTPEQGQNPSSERTASTEADPAKAVDGNAPRGANQPEMRPPQSSGSKVVVIVAITGVVIIIGLGIVGILAAIFIPNLVKSRQAANEAAAIRAVREIVKGEVIHSATVGNGEFTDLRTLVAEGTVDSKLASGQLNGYRFVSIPVNPGRKPPMFDTMAIPLSAGAAGTGNRSFGCNEQYILFEAKGAVEVKGTATNRVPANGHPIN